MTVVFLIAVMIWHDGGDMFMRKAKEVADALLAMVTTERDALRQDGKPND